MALSDRPSPTRRALPPGRRRRADFPRFGRSLRPPPQVPDDPVLAVTGAVEHALRLPIAELVAACPAPTSSPTSTASPPGRPPTSAGPGSRSAIDLRDALADDVLLADRLGGVPLDGAHGAPLRFVSPGQYGFNNIEHLAGIEVVRRLPKPGLLLGEHRRARVALEERATPG
ncbi:MAG TPA: molybdopterin-dependent oxidoreductase [Pseudonocardia sp.]|uniref:molybdopterin-dependent oxidoreductase n=1 Tax=Pseudonocardia sp. TaxID=60912 RepID=UPI002B4B3F88|nr:molybdopterin-dependent oxidoreductase [Pseudonocardia sp.]HLU58807.1 molybdopterin-dependent oxidoreductase [Pseudonocardia sp.]